MKPFPVLRLDDPPSTWVAWNLAGAADRLDELAFQVKLVRPLRGDKHAPSSLDAVIACILDGGADRLTDLERKRAVDELADADPATPQHVLATGLWTAAAAEPELRLHMLRRVARHVIAADPIAPAVLATFPAFAVEPPAEVTEVCLMLEALIDASADPASKDMLGTTVMRDYVVRELGLTR